jgi:pimeloyl-ACP methyl ester carboxylesterase
MNITVWSQRADRRKAHEAAPAGGACSGGGIPRLWGEYPTLSLLRRRLLTAVGVLSRSAVLSACAALMLVRQLETTVPEPQGEPTMSTRTIARLGVSTLAALAVLLAAVASGYTQANDPVFVPLIQQDDQAVVASGQRDDKDDDTPAKTRPTIVLVHGAWADGSSWNGVTPRLQAEGYNVWVVPNPLRGLSADAAYVASILKTIPGPIILVAHSYGGAVITNAATGNPNVKALVYIDGFALDEGESVLQLAGMPPPPGQSQSCVSGDPATLFNAVPYPGAQNGDVDLYIKPEVFPSCFANTIAAKQAEVLAASQRPVALSALAEPSGPPAWKAIPAWYLVGTLDNVIPPYAQLFMAQRAHAQIVQVKAPHPAMLSVPNAVADLIETAAQAVVATP